MGIEAKRLERRAAIKAEMVSKKVYMYRPMHLVEVRDGCTGHCRVSYINIILLKFYFCRNDDIQKRWQWQCLVPRGLLKWLLHSWVRVRHEKILARSIPLNNYQ